ncbi:MAG: hypothetical protein QXI19_13625, partial [Candidatus Caldarchaeum sp.]
MILLVSLLLTTPNTITAPGILTFQRHHPVFQQWDFLGQRLQILEEPPPELILPNNFPQKVTVLSFVIGMPPQTRYAVYVREKGVLYVDSDGNNSIKDEPPLHEEH